MRSFRISSFHYLFRSIFSSEGEQRFRVTFDRGTDPRRSVGAMFDSITSHALHSENMRRRTPPSFSPTISRRAQSAGSLLNDNAASEATRSDWIDKNNLFEQSRVGGTMPTTTYLSNRSRQKWRKKLPIEISKSTNTTRNSTPLRKARTSDTFHVRWRRIWRLRWHPAPLNPGLASTFGTQRMPV